MYEWLLYAHLLGVGLLVAGLGTHTVSVERLRRSETTRELAALMSTAEVGSKLVLSGGPILIAAGLTMAIRSWSLTDGWIATAIALVLGQGVLGSIVDRRLKDVRAAVRAAPDGRPSSELSARMSDPVLNAGNGVSVAVIAEILLLMSVKPAGWEILWSLLGTAAVAGVAVWRAVRLRGAVRERSSRHIRKVPSTALRAARNSHQDSSELDPIRAEAPRHTECTSSKVR